MMRRTPWFERRFPPIDDNGLLPGILERLDGTADRLRSMTARAPDAEDPRPGWTLAQEVGHLIDLEPLWLQRALEILSGRSVLTAADLTNRATHDGDHDQWPLDQLVARFGVARRRLVLALRGAGPEALEHSALHPRLGTPMRLIDLAYFVAEHDDHHLARIRQLVEPGPAS